MPGRDANNIIDPFLAKEICQCNRWLSEETFQHRSENDIKKRWATLLYNTIERGALKVSVIYTSINGCEIALTSSHGGTMCIVTRCGRSMFQREPGSPGEGTEIDPVESDFYYKIPTTKCCRYLSAGTALGSRDTTPRRLKSAAMPSTSASRRKKSLTTEQ